ncbi:MAG: hypothetical protein GEV12_18720 [Micromonosporaceae bacterium]|nr:hypothetical protein [Micromonosporaceae bacterium]
MPPVSSPSPLRPPADRCPGALRPHQAADGPLVRLRLPGGQIDPGALRVLATAAHRSGDGWLELTSRGNVQLRGLTAGAVQSVADQCAGAGLLPSATHERVRNILGSPLSGRDGLGAADIRPLVRQLDAALCADPALAALPGRFLFAVDDGRADVTGFDTDVAWQAGTGTLLLAGRGTGLRVAGDRAVAAMLAAAREFLAQGGGREGSWRMSDLDGGTERVGAALTARGLASPAVASPAPDALGAPRTLGLPGSPAVPGSPARERPAPAPPVGLPPAGASPWAVLAVPLGRLSAGQATLLAATADAAGGAVVVTPWRSVVVDLDPADPAGQLLRLTGAGLVDDPGSPWVGLSACAGTTGCASALADVRTDAAALAAPPATVVATRPATVLAAAPAGRRPPPGGAPGEPAPAGGVVHWAGCERRCGQPVGPVLVAVATGTGYRLHPPAGAPVTVGSAAAARAFAARWRRRSAGTAPRTPRPAPSREAA